MGIKRTASSRQLTSKSAISIDFEAKNAKKKQTNTFSLCVFEPIPLFIGIQNSHRKMTSEFIENLGHTVIDLIKKESQVVKRSDEK